MTTVYKKKKTHTHTHGIYKKSKKKPIKNVYNIFPYELSRRAYRMCLYFFIFFIRSVFIRRPTDWL